MKESITQRLRDSWSRSDEIFDLLDPEALHEQPIGLRQPLIFYLGHLPAFAWNLLGGWLFAISAGLAFSVMLIALWAQRSS